MGERGSTTEDALADVRSGLKSLRLGVVIAHLDGLVALLEGKTELDTPSLCVLLEAARVFLAFLEGEASAIGRASLPSQTGEGQRGQG